MKNHIYAGKPYRPVMATYLLGAGFSKAITANFSKMNDKEYPLANEVLSARYLDDPRYLKDSPLEQFPEWHKTDIQFLDFMTADFGASWLDGAGWMKDGQHANYEEAYSYLTTVMFSYPSTAYEMKFERVKWLLDEYLMSLLDVVNYNWGGMLNRVWALAREIPSRSLVFTTNQDNILEHCILQREDNQIYAIGKHADHIPAFYSSEREEEIFQKLADSSDEWRFLYKLHGSINWHRCQNTVCPEYQRPYEGPTCSYIINYKAGKPAAKMFCATCGSRMEHEFMSPTFMKNYGDSLFYASLLRRLWTSIQQSRYIVFVGYSFSNTDAALRSWIRSALQESENMIITIADPNYERIEGIMRQWGLWGRTRFYRSAWDLKLDMFPWP